MHHWHRFAIVSCLFLTTTMSAFGKAMAKARSGAGVVWYKSTDLRIRDHQPLTLAHLECESVDHVYCFDPRHFRTTRKGHLKTNLRRLQYQVDCLNDLAKSLQEKGTRLTVMIGKPEVVLPAYINTLNSQPSKKVYCHDEICHEETKVFEATKQTLQECGVTIQSSWGGGTLLDPSDLPFEIKNLSLFTAFRKAVEQPRVWEKVKEPLPTPSFVPPCTTISSTTTTATATATTTTSQAKDSTFHPLSMPITDITSLWSTLRHSQDNALPDVNDVHDREIDPRAVLQFTGDKTAVHILSHPLHSHPHNWCLASHTAPHVGGETSAWSRLDHYIKQGHIRGRLCTYKETRNGLVGADYSSKLSPYMATGTVTARSIYAEVKAFEQRSGIADENTYWLIFELLWRDYMKFYALKHGRDMFMLGGVQGEVGRNKYPWATNPDLLNAWKEGKTGYPFIDANMRELKMSGWMSNRGRQVVASFLVRDLGLDWREGAEHFESYLVDHDPCSNWGNWQYCAGVGADPREDRYFNIVKQGRNYDPDASFVRLWLPELAHLPTDALLDTRLFTKRIREVHQITESLYPMPVCTLQHAGYKGEPDHGATSGGKGTGTGTASSSSGKSSKPRMKQPNHGGVPGNNRMIDMNALVKQHTSKK